MKLAGDYLFEAPVDEVWSALMDPVVLAAVMPGCEKLDKDGDVFVGDMNIKVGPVQGKFGGKVELKDVVAPTGYTMIIDGRGVPGFVKATAKVLIEAEGTGTRIKYDADAQVGGKIASVGQRLIEATAKAIAKQSLDGLHENIKIRAAAHKEHKEAEAPEPAAKEPEPAKADAPGAAAETAEAVETKNEEPAKAARSVETTSEAPANVDAAKAAEPTTSTKSEAPSTKKVPPPVVLKKVDQKAFAAAVAKEVTKSLVPPPVLIGVAVAVVAVVVYFIVR